MNINELKSKNFNQLVQIGAELGLDDARGMRHYEGLEHIKADARRTRYYLLRVSMITSLRRAQELG